MADDYLRILPQDPGCVPAPERQEAGRAALRRLVPNADQVEVTVSDEVRFVDAGVNFERVLCPLCVIDVTNWWGHAMDAACASRFEDLDATLPCCGTGMSLNDLVYEWPAGFARFVLEARNANIGGGLLANEVAEIGRALGCRVRQVVVHY